MNRDLARTVGAGLLAGLAGTVAVSTSTALEARLRRRHVPTAAAPIMQSALGIETFESPAAEARFARVAHLGYGAGWGILHGLLRGLGLGPNTATAASFSAVWGGALVLLPSHDVAPPVFLRERVDIAAEAWHQLVFAASTGVAYELLARRRPRDL